MANPYQSLAPSSFWRPAVAEKNPFDLSDLYEPKFEIKPSDNVATAGSCFAQHIAVRLRAAGFTFLDVEPAPLFLSDDTAFDFGFNTYSARFGNIYTVRQLLQLVRRSTGDFKPQENYWESDGRIYDAFRPNIEPGGFESVAEFQACQRGHLSKVRELFQRADVFVFTLGLTEAWLSTLDGAVFPMCPGTAAGEFSDERHEFKNFDFREIYDDAAEMIAEVRALNPNVRFLLTVSPVPLVATASGKHVLVANTYSKSTLRSVAGALANEFDNVGYFPSYEIITGSTTRSMFFDPDMRSVNAAGVETVMRHFFASHPPASNQAAQTGKAPQRDPFCDQIELDSN